MNTTLKERNNDFKYVDRRKTDRRKTDKAISKVKFWHWFTGVTDMCRKAPVCPRFERRSKDGIDGACANCEYLKKERKQLWLLRGVSLLSFAAFIITTYYRFG